MLLSNRTELCADNPSGNASLPDCFFLSSLRDAGTLGGFHPPTSSLRTSLQTPSSLRAALGSTVYVPYILIACRCFITSFAITPVKMPVSTPETIRTGR